MANRGGDSSARVAWADTVGRAGFRREAMSSLNTDVGLLVTGWLGTGKSHVLDELACELRAAGRPVVHVRGSASAGELVLGAFAEFVAQAPPGSQPVELLDQVHRALVALAPKGLVVVVDDAARLDAASAVLVHNLARARIAPVVLAARTGDRLPDALEALQDDGLVAPVLLGPLEPYDARALVRRLAVSLSDRDVTEICRVAQGVPLFLEALVHDRQEAGDGAGAASDLAATVLRRVGRLDDDDRRVLELVALAEPLELRHAEHLASPATLARLQQRLLLAVDQDGGRLTVRLQHPLYSEAVKRELPEFRRRALLRELAAERRIDDRHRRPHDLLRLVMWQLDAGEAVADDELVAAAGASVSFAAAGPASLRLARLAWERAPSGVTGFVLAAALLSAGQPAEVDAHCAALEPPDDEGMRTNLAVTWAVAVWTGMGDAARAVEIIDRFRAGVGPAGRHELDTAEVMIRFYTGHVAEAVEVVDRLLASPELTARARLWALLPGVMSLAAAGRTVDALRLGHEARELAAQVRAEVVLADTQAACVWGYAAMLNGEAEACVASLTEHVHHAEVTFDAVSTEILNVTLGLGLRQTGQFAAAAAAFAQLNPAPDLFSLNWLPFARAWRAECLARLGRVDEARPLLEPNPMGGPDSMHRAELEVAAAEVDAAAGEPALAARRLDAAAASAERFGQVAVAMAARFRALVLEPTETRAEAVVVLAPRHDGFRADAMVEAAAAWQRADLDAVCAVASRAEGRGLGMLALDCWELAVRLSHEAGDAEQAMRVRRRSEAWREHLRVVPVATGPVLTDREWQVGGLAAAGTTDKAISAQLDISVRTVHAHLRNVYTKLDVEGRNQLAGHPYFRRPRGGPPARANR